MLKGVDSRVSPELLYALARMGHGDTLAVVDRNYPAYSMGGEVCRMDALSAPEVIDIVAALIPIDDSDEVSFRYMEGSRGEDLRPVASEALAAAQHNEKETIKAAPVPRMEFYREARNARLILVSGEDRPYGCFLLAKGYLA